MDYSSFGKIDDHNHDGLYLKSKIWPLSNIKKEHVKYYCKPIVHKTVEGLSTSSDFYDTLIIEKCHFQCQW